MSREKNGWRTLMLWIMGTLFTIVSGLAAWDRTLIENRVRNIEVHSGDVALLRSDLVALRREVCELTGKVNLLVEEQTGRRQYQTPCQ
jgi:hypothetical protein